MLDLTAHPLPWKRNGNGYGRTIVDAAGARVGYMHPPTLAADLATDAELIAALYDRFGAKW